MRSLGSGTWLILPAITSNAQPGRSRLSQAFPGDHYKPSWRKGFGLGSDASNATRLSISHSVSARLDVLLEPGILCGMNVLPAIHPLDLDQRYSGFRIEFLLK